MFFLALSALVSTVVTQAWPVRVSSAVGDRCSQQHSNVISDKDYEAVQLEINERYGPPSCMCGAHQNWKRLVFLNMTNSLHQCPSAWNAINAPVRGCGRSTEAASCDSAIFPSSGFRYNHVCGRIIGYQRGTPDAFHNISSNMNAIDIPYVDGISLTHGAAGSRQHIWTFAAALYARASNELTCSCTNINDNWWPYQVPSFVGNNYFCETGNHNSTIEWERIYLNNPLWDGKGCLPTSSCCEFNHPSWFCTSIPDATSDDLEIRICHDQEAAQEDVIIFLAEIYASLI